MSSNEAKIFAIRLFKHDIFLTEIENSGSFAKKKNIFFAKNELIIHFARLKLVS